MLPATIKEPAVTRRSTAVSTPPRTATPGLCLRPPGVALQGRRPPRQHRLVVEIPPQVLGHRIGRRITTIGVLVDRLQDDRLEVARNPAVHRSRPDRLLGLDPLDHLEPVGRLEPRAERQQLVERQAQGIDVGAGVALAAEPLRGHVADACPGCRRWPSARRRRPWPARSRRSRPHPAVSSSRFDGLMSRWMMPRAWA